MADGMSDADIGLSDSDIGLPEAQPSEQAPTQASGLSDADIGLSDADIGLPAAPSKPAPESALASGVRSAAHAVLPGVGALAGMGAGAAVGSAVGPVGTFFGGLGGLIIGSMATDKVQQAGMDALGIDDAGQMAANEEAHPVASTAGSIVGSLAGMDPMAAGVTMGERAVGGGAMAAFDAGQQYVNKGSIDPTEVALSGAAGAVAPRLNKAGEAITQAGARAAGKVAGRPASQPNPDAAPAQDEAEASQQATTSGDQSLEQQAPTADGSTSGNPQSAPSRSARISAVRSRSVRSGGLTLSKPPRRFMSLMPSKCR